MASDIAFNLTLPYTEFQTYICEEIMTAQFNPFVDDEGNIEILYKYGEYKNGKSLIKFRVPGLDKMFLVRYSGSSAFAMWWCGLTDGKEDEETTAVSPCVAFGCTETGNEMVWVATHGWMCKKHRD